MKYIENNKTHGTRYPSATNSNWALILSHTACIYEVLPRSYAKFIELAWQSFISVILKKSPLACNTNPNTVPMIGKPCCNKVFFVCCNLCISWQFRGTWSPSLNHCTGSRDYILCVFPCGQGRFTRFESSTVSNCAKQKTQGKELLVGVWYK